MTHDHTSSTSHAHDDHNHDHTHAHSHSHGLGHHHHHHGANETRTLIAACLTGGFMLVEVIGGLLTGSLALLADAAHMLTDFAALLLAWLGFRLSRRPAEGRLTYGFDRLQILAAFANGIVLAVMSLWIIIEAIERLTAKPEVMGLPMMVVAGLGLLVNIGAFAILHGADRDNLNIRGALAHVIGDLLGSLAALLSALVIILTGWMAIDAVLSILISVLIGYSALGLIRDSGRILLEEAPLHLDPSEIREDLVAHVAGVIDAHHIHVWSITQDRPMATLHLCVAKNLSQLEVMEAAKTRLLQRFGLSHVTIQIEHETCFN